MESPKLMQQLLSGTISVPPVKHTPVYQSSDTQASANTLTLSNATRNEMKDIRDAADVRMKLGQVKKYCDTLCSLGEWDKALAVAPALGLDYWRSLIKRYGKRVQTDSELSQVAAHRHALVPLMLAAGDVASAVDVLVEESDLENAYLVAVSAEAGSFDFSSDCAKPANGAAHALEGGIAALSMSPTGTTIDAAAVMAAAKKLVIKKVAALGVDQQNKTTNARTPSAIKIGSTWKMSVGDVMGAFENLVNGGELDHALGLATVFDFIDQKHQILRKLELQLDEEKKLALAM